MDGFLNARLGGEDQGAATFTFERMDDASAAATAVREGSLAGAVIIERQADGGLDFRVLSVGGLSPDRAQLLQIGSFAVGVLDWTASQPPSSDPFVVPGFEVVDAGAVGGAGGSGAAAIDTAEYASRRIVGIVFVVLSFLTLVFYGLWVASGVVAEKAGRVMELLISAATAPQLVVGQDRGHRARRPDAGVAGAHPGGRRPVRGGRDRQPDPRAGVGHGVARGPLAGAHRGVPRVLRAGLRALRGPVRGRGLDAQPRRGPADRRAAAVDPRDHGLPAGGARAVRRDVGVHPVRLVRAAVEPVRDALAARGRHGGALGARALARAC